LKRIAVFDLDKTLVKDNASYKFGSFLFAQRIFSVFSMLYCVSYYALHQVHILTIHQLHRALFNRLFRGHSLAFFCEMASSFIEQHIHTMAYQPAYQKLKEAKEQGHYTLLLSSSPDFLVEKMAAYFEVDEWAATPYLTDQEKRLTHLGPVFDGAAKADYLRDLMDKLSLPKGAVTAFSDSFLDLPLLESVGQPIAVNPDSRLKAICLKRNWEII
jgi:HAD superfamily hydrolase (TIGR01490 family)